jgi:hypothetical protein
MSVPIPPEFSRILSTTRLSSRVSVHRIAANDEERASLALRFGLLSLDRLDAEIRLVRIAGGEVRLDGTLEADLVQPCVVTLEPVAARLSDVFSLIYRPGLDEEAADRLALEDPGDALIEPLIGDVIDIGEAVAQQLAVVMDPYPRASGADATGVGPGVETAAEIPLAELSALKRQ